MKRILAVLVSQSVFFALSFSSSSLASFPLALSSLCPSRLPSSQGVPNTHFNGFENCSMGPRVQDDIRAHINTGSNMQRGAVASSSEKLKLNCVSNNRDSRYFSPALPLDLVFKEARFETCPGFCHCLLDCTQDPFSLFFSLLSWKDPSFLGLVCG